jgi:D-alanyl-D-alanine carboxypeptidase/D-alanyl-D-alanine-endopeptidase (penicillin-binding protein 4)
MSNMVLNNRFVVFFVLCFLNCPVFLKAQSSIFSGVPDHASVAFLVRDLETGKDVARHNPRKALISASLMKLVTTATALDALGYDFLFTTRIWGRGDIANGILYGDIIIEGGGDPTLGSRYFPYQAPAKVIAGIKYMLENSGIYNISGNIYVDESYLSAPRFPSQRLWEDMANYYGAPPSAVTWRDNSFELVLQSPAGEGQLCRVVSVSPNTTNLLFDCRVRAAAHNKDSAYIYGYPGLKQWQVRGSMPAGREQFTIKGALPNPGLTFAREVADLFIKGGKPIVKMNLVPDWKNNAFLLWEMNSPPLADIVRETNQRSINLFADHLLVALGHTVADTIQCNWDNGIAFIEKYWQKKGGDYFFSMKDGSGLAPLNTLSPAFLVEMLDYMYNSSTVFPAFKSSLARSGISGTLKYMWRDPKLLGNIYGKSGSMRDVMGYAGFVFRPGKSPLAFAVLVNHHGLDNKDMRRIIEKGMSDLFKEI